MYQLESLTGSRNAFRSALGHGQWTAPNVSETTSHKAMPDHAHLYGQWTAPNVLESISHKASPTDNYVHDRPLEDTLSDNEKGEC